MAKVIMEQSLKEQKLEDKISVDSAGTSVYEPSATPETRQVIMELYGADLLAQHVPKAVTNLNLNEFDLILTMTESLKRSLPSAKTCTLKEYAGSKGNIQDPCKMEIDAYRQCRDEIKNYVHTIVEKISCSLL